MHKFFKGLVSLALEIHRNEVGALVTSDLLAALTTNYRAIFQKSLDEFSPQMNDWQKIATEFQSSTDKETYGWLGAPPSMSEWKDQRQYKTPGAYDYTLTNKHYEGTIEIDRDTYEDDKYGLIPPRVRGLANRALKHFQERVFSQLDDGATLLAYDGTALFADTRVIGAGANIDNLLSGSYSGDADEIRAALAAAVVKMANYQDEWGKPLNLVPDLIVCSPTMYIPILNALLPAVAGTTRPEAGIFRNENIIMTPWVDSDVLDWYILCTKAEVKPIVFQMRKRPEFIALDDPKGDHVFKNKTFLYGVDDRFQVGYGDPRTAIKIVDA